MEANYAGGEEAASLANRRCVIALRVWVIFDLDGTLIESEQIWDEVRLEFVTSHGGRWHDGAQREMMGMRTQEWAQYIHAELGVPLPANAIAEAVVDRVIERLCAHLPILPGATDALGGLVNAFTLGLATSSARRVANDVLEQTGWSEMFAAIVSADEVARGKPSPDVYLRAVEMLGADRPSTAAIEDSGNGIRSAHAAALAVVAIPNRAYPPEDDALSLASRIIPDLGRLDVTLIADAVRQRSGA